MSAPHPIPPFFGREPELVRLRACLEQASAGHGKLVLVAGEPGIGKTRLAHKLASIAASGGATTLFGASYDGEWAPAYGPFAEALTGLFRLLNADTARALVATSAGVLARVVPALGDLLPEIEEPVPLAANEERFRLFDATSQLLLRLAAERPTVLVLDDLHWTDSGSLAMLRHVARFAPRHALLIVGAYRDGEIDAAHPLTECLGALYRETECEQIALRGLAPESVAELVDALLAISPAATSEAIDRQSFHQQVGEKTAGNPFFVREYVLSSVESRDASLPGDAPPDSVRQVLRRRVARLSDAARQLLAAATAFAGDFRLDVVGAVAVLDEGRQLEAIESCLRAQLITPGDGGETYRFAHALIRDTIYSEMSPSRQVRLHRRIAETMEWVLGDRAREHAAEIAHQYHRSRSLPGAERGAAHAVLAAENARAAFSFEEVARQLRVALDLLPAADETRIDLESKLGVALCATLAFDEALRVAVRAGESLAARSGPAAAADYFANVVVAMNDVGGYETAFAAAKKGLEYAGARRDVTWAVLAAIDTLGRETKDPSNPGIPLDSAERREIAHILASDVAISNEIDRAAGGIGSGFYAYNFSSRSDLIERNFSKTTWALGEYREGAVLWRELAENAERTCRLAIAVGCWSSVCRFLLALGEIEPALGARSRAVDLAQRLARASTGTAQLIAAEDEWRMLRDEGWDRPFEGMGPGFGDGAVTAIYRAARLGASGRTHARMGRAEKALARLADLIPAIEQAPAWAENYVRLCCDATEILWLTRRMEHLDAIEQNLRDKVLRADFRYPMSDARLALARLCALRQASEDATEWFARARDVLDEQGARPLRAITDYDEGLMLVRRGADGDRDLARPLLETALAQFRAIGMPGWIRRAEALLHEEREANASEWAADAPEVSEVPARERSPASVSPRTEAGRFRRSGDIWLIEFAGTSVQLKHNRGLQFIAQLLARPGADVSAVELVATGRGGSRGTAGGFGVAAQVASNPREDGFGISSDAGEHLDAAAVRQYRDRLRDLAAELDEARDNNDIGRVSLLQSEVDMLEQELSRAIGLGGRVRRAGSTSERARINVTRAITDALAKIARSHPALEKHLRDTVRTGTFCSYRPDPRLPIRWET